MRDEVCRVIRLHLVKHVGRAVVIELVQDVDLLVFGHLLEHIGEAVVAQLLGNLEHALLGQVEHGAGQVGGKHVGVAGHELGGGLRFAGRGILDQVVPVGEDRRALGEGRATGLGAAQEHLTDLPVAETDFFDRDILDVGVAGAVAQAHLAAQHFGDDSHLAAALFETAQVDEARGDDLTRTDAGDPPDRQEHPALARNLKNHSHHARPAVRAVHHQHVANLADPVAVGVENGAPDQPGGEDSGRAHG